MNTEKPKDMKFAIAVDMGGTKTLVGLVEDRGLMQNIIRFPTDITRSPQDHLDRCIQAIQQCLKETGVNFSNIVGIGIAVPGLADSKKGLLRYAPYSGWRDVPVAQYIKDAFPDKPVRIANDVNACAIGELRFGRGKLYRNFLWVTVSTGIGAGLIVNGELAEGETGLSGELGHVIVEWNQGRRCGCGHYGCLEAHASGTAIADLIREQSSQEEKDSTISSYFMEKKIEISTENIAKAARDGCPWAIHAFHQAGCQLGRAFSYYINILNPGCIIIGGGVGLSLDLMKDSIRETIFSSVIGEENKSVSIMQTALGYEAGLIGAASLIFANDSIH